MQLLSPFPWILLPVRSALCSLLESPGKAGNKLSDSQVCLSLCLSRKSVMAFHSVQSIPPLLKTQEHGEGNTAFETLPLKQKTTAELSTAGIRTWGRRSRLGCCVFFVYVPSHHPSCLSFLLPQSTRSQSKKRFPALLKCAKKLRICLAWWKK